MRVIAQRSDKRQSLRRFIPLIPLLMMVLAALACQPDIPSIPARVVDIAADPQIAGKAYALVEDKHGGYDGKKAIPRFIYETADYGSTWQHSNLTTLPVSSSSNAVMMGDDLLINGARVWSMPRSIFRRAYFRSLESYFTLLGAVHDYSPPGGWNVDDVVNIAISPAAPDIMYAAMGTEGVLVGPNPNSTNRSTRQWELTYQGIDKISPVYPHLAFHTLGDLNHALFWLFLMPPLPLIHAWLLVQVWRYMYPVSETRKVYWIAGITSVVFVIPASIIFAIWLIDIQADFYPTIGLIGVIYIVTSVGVAITLGRRRQFTDAFVRRSALVTGLVSAIVPLGILVDKSVNSMTNPLMWPLILVGCVGFVLFRHAIRSYLDRLNADTTQWQTDRLALELTTLITIMILPIGVLATTAWGTGSLVVALIVVLVSLLGLRLYIGWRGRSIVIKKKRTPLDTSLQDEPFFQGRRWWETIIGHAVGWIGVSIALTVSMMVAEVIISILPI